MVEKFLPVGRFNSLRSSDPVLLLSGPPSSGKTSLLFQFAINSATESREGNVVFICNRRKLETKPPYLAQGIDPFSDSTIFERIQMKYIEDEEGIKKYFAAFHMHNNPAPVSVIIDDFADFFNEGKCQEKYNNNRGKDLAMVRVLALCKNAMMYANQKGSLPCQLLLSDTHYHSDSPRLLYIYKRWVSSIYTIKADGFGSYLIRSSSNNFARAKTAKYSIALQYLVVEDITENEEQLDE
ncbi:uncharacterized protein LOC107759245 [Nicotiana tabacum]|uniref:Uncharacterized protein LOC107759245 n=2 Tax=Nicotiana TaxID=4085 RepID=A0A1S3WY69_TOBAC|nr:PREDICTED: uncharacterized protein LOC104235300 [Nicotiana sylvestris]XP_009787332.1 PREDICTED: uncharacterized protein LOC104235300 [Nicotiana sylvestris]XP_009787333.1 PREDICTED: uncharacterized protein LOC104235300 [Nicotiana sylvestris]XP_009787334.1 PREDICTED: uncharacterized protein LOC104235300 [Nicotiana sylvestris]XP_016432618.1 PREDICTED: uncharacterized protein LOC107759245 [Nicotiana tabacum]